MNTERELAMRRWNALWVLTLAAAVACAEGGEELDTETGQAASQATASASAATLPDEDVRTILALDRTFQDAVGGGDWEALRGVYAADAVLIPAEGTSVEGVDGIVASFADANPDTGLADFHTATDVIHGDDTIGYHRGTWTGTIDGEAVTGNFLWVLRRQPDGSWRIVVDMFNRSQGN